MDERMLRLYAFLVRLGRMKAESVPEPYRKALLAEQTKQ